MGPSVLRIKFEGLAKVAFGLRASPALGEQISELPVRGRVRLDQVPTRS